MSDLAKFIDAKRQNRLDAYRNEPKDIQEHAGIEETVLAGGYGYRQVLELVQNGADAILEALDSLSGTSQESRIEVILSDRNLYVANTGAPLSHDGVEALLHSHSSPKRGNQIGRFGLGFKSLLRLGGKLDIFSSSGSLRFDPECCQSEIREAFQLDGSTPVPGLRLAWALNREEEEATDPVLNGFPWATTIVRAEIRNADILPHLREEITRFPSPFLLFLPLAVTLNLDAGNGEKRRLRREPDGPDILLRDGDTVSRWRVFERQEVRIADPEAENDATHLHARKVVPLAWAMPLEGHREQGRFWAFFPTDTPTRLPGILNAPWKLNSDRKALIPGAWNTALMREAARLITEHLPDLATVSDPGRPLDAFPRQLERHDEPAAPLVNAIWQAIKTTSIIPDAQGKLRPATELQRPPLNDPELHEAWRELANQEAQARWVHATCLSERERCARLSDLSQRLPYSSSPRLDQATAEKWFLDIATADLLGAKAVLALVSTYAGKREPYNWNQERPTLAIIPSESGRICTPDQLIIPPLGVSLPGRECVAPALVGDPETLRVLTGVLGVKRLDDAGWRGLLEQDFALKKWLFLWETLRRAPNAVGDDFLINRRDQIPVRRRDGSWVLHDQVLLPGEIVAVDDPDENNRKVLVDEDTHGNDQERLRAIGVGASPSGVRGPGSYAEVLGDSQSQSQFSAWLGFAETDYRNQLDANRNPQAGYLRPLSLSMPNGWMLLSRLKGLANSRLTSNLFETLTRMDDRVEFGHTTQGKHYRPTQVAHPMRWYLREHGTFAIGNHAIPLKTLLARRETKVLGRLDSWSSFKTQLDPLADLPGAPAPAQPTPAQLSAFWRALFDHFVTPEALAGDGLLTLWTEAARDEQVPESVPSASGPVPLAEIYVSGSGTLTRRARDQGKTAITLEAEALRLWLERGARHLDSLFRAEWAEALDAPMPLATLAPELGEVLRNEAETLSCPVHDLRLVIDGESQATPCLLWDGLLYLDPVQLERLTRVERLAAILREAGAAGWLNPSIDEAQNRIANAQLQTNRDRVAAGETLPERLLLAVGGKVEALIGVLGENVRNILPPDCEPKRVAELALARRGPAILQDLHQTLKDEGLRPPTRWGGDEARAFVSSLGFPEDFAAATGSRREAEEYISGPIPLGALHDYQEEVINGLRGLIQSGTGRRRAVVSLPTGGGKTRVTVQAAVDLILKSETCTRSVLWVAQTDELCEQAVQAFRQVWLNRGVDRMDLRIVRLWGGNQNPAAPPARQPTAVVASIQTLNNRVGRDDLAWLSQPGLVVVDECHHAIAPSYTGLLKWLNAKAPRPGSPPRDEPPIIGLSATPFRGNNDDEESRRLATRFDGRWLPADQAALHEKLTHGGMLSIAEHEALKSPAVLPDELVERMRRQSDMDRIQFDNFLEEINRMLADDEDRNRLLLDTIADSEEQSILFFTNSVRHAEEMADRLNLAGISAHAVSGDTPTSARRYFLERSQRGEARVLCNHSVLTTGFDAPKTDMVLIARQVSSPVLYMQMVGRGLRGKANGGTERCRIVTVEENLGKFRDRLPYDFCARYFV
jgi:superfamily II DNA or RNA helicase